MERERCIRLHTTANMFLKISVYYYQVPNNSPSKSYSSMPFAHSSNYYDNVAKAAPCLFQFSLLGFQDMSMDHDLKYRLVISNFMVDDKQSNTTNEILKSKVQNIEAEFL